MNDGTTPPQGGDAVKRDQRGAKNHRLKARLLIVEMIEGLLGAGHCILLTKSLGIYEASAGRKNSAAETLESCIEELTDNPRRKQCTREDCESAGRPMPLSRFTHEPDSRDGRANVCKKCESKRTSRYGKKHKGSKEHGDAGPPQGTIPQES